MTIDVDATATGTPLEPVWAYHGYDEPNYTTTPEGEALLRTLAEAHTAPVHTRTHFLTGQFRYYDVSAPDLCRPCEYRKYYQDIW